MIPPCSLGAMAFPFSSGPPGSCFKLALLVSHFKAERFHVKPQYLRSENLLLNAAFRNYPSSSLLVSKKRFGKENRGGKEYLKEHPFAQLC